MTKSGIKGYDWHHVRPRSRGGGEERNCILVPSETLHVPYHKLFRNLWPHEIALLLFFCWETQNPNLHTNRYDNSSACRYVNAWNMLFGVGADKDGAIRTLERKLLAIQTDEIVPETTVQMHRAKKIIECAKRCNLADRNCASGKIVSCDNEQPQLQYGRIFGTLYPHEAILLTFLSWQTVCAAEELAIPQSPKNERGGPAAKTFGLRIKTWNELFEGLDVWGVVEEIEREFCGGKIPRGTENSVTYAMRLCRDLERFACVQYAKQY